LAKTEPIILRAIEGGVNYIDTGYFYLGAEDVIGATLARHHLRDKVHFATKLPLSLTRGPDDFDKFFGKQLERIRSPYIDYYLIHMLPDMASGKSLCSWGIEEWLARRKREGSIRAVGFSFHGQAAEFRALLDAYDWDCCQIQLNYSDERFQAGVEGLEYAGRKGIGVMVMEPLLGGKLAGGLPPAARAILHDANSQRSPAEWGMRWVWNHPEVTVALSGVARMSDIEENLHSADNAPPAGALPDNERAVYTRVQEVFRASYKVLCTGCNYCMPCPAGVNIPGCFAAYNQSFLYGLVQGMWSYVTSNVRADSKELGGAGLCRKCGACEKKCSQRLPIIESLAQVRKRLEPWWFRVPLDIAGAIFKRLQRRDKRKKHCHNP
jgi:predicted aldo/keto reductase-like oxidoreductase